MATYMAKRILFLLRLYVTLLLVFVTQKVLFMLFNLPSAGGTSFGEWMAVLWHGLPLDSVAACYLLAVPAVAVVVSCFCGRVPLRRVLTPYYVLAAVVMALCFAADTVLYRFWGAKVDAADLMYAAKPKDMLASVTLPAILVGTLAIGLLVFHYLRRLRHATPLLLPRVRPVWALAMIPLLALQLLGLRGGLGDSTANPSYAYFSDKPFLNHAALNPLFNITHSLFKTEDLSSQFQFYDNDHLSRFAPAYPHDGTLADTLLSTQRPDILLIVWEGAGSAMTGPDSVAPNLHRWQRKGVYFSNCYANSFRTDRGLVAVVNGWPALPTTSLMKKADMGRKLPSLARTLRDNGYSTAFYYGGDVDFTNMRGHLYESGFSTVCGQEHYPASLPRGSWGVHDGAFLRALPTSAPSPWFTALLTLSSHEPWDVPMHRLADERRNAFAYTDSCIGHLLDSLSLTPAWRNMLVVIVADHGIPVDLPASSRHLATRIPVVWTGGAVRQPREVDVLMNQSDLAATLLAQLGMDISGFTFSRNVLAPSYTAPFAVNAYKNGFYYIDTTGVTSFDCLSLSEADGAYPHDTERLHRAKAHLQLLYLTTGLLR